MPASPPTPFACQPLESRVLLAGVTLVAHGQSSGSPASPWVAGLGAAIAEAAGVDAVAGTITVVRDGGGVTATSDFEPIPSAWDSGEFVIAVDWTDASGGLFFPTNDTFEVAEAVAAELLRADAVAGFGRALATLPLHLIGHSRGASLVSEIARELASVGVWVDHLTSLDPYPRGGDAPVGAASTVVHFDNYFQTSVFPSGTSLGSQAFDRSLPSLSGGYGGFSGNHSDVHLWYHGSADLTPSASDGEESVGDRGSWYSGAEQGGALAGWAYSRLGGGDRLSSFAPAGADAIRAGYHADLGGLGSREATDLSGATWPSVLRVSHGVTEPIAIGQTLEFSAAIQDVDSNASVIFRLDTNRNPYDGMPGRTVAGVLAPATPGGPITVTRPADTAGLVPGRYFLSAEINDGSHRRVLYAEAELTLTAGAPAAASVPALLDLASAGIAEGTEPAAPAAVADGAGVWWYGADVASQPGSISV